MDRDNYEMFMPHVDLSTGDRIGIIYTKIICTHHRNILEINKNKRFCS